MGFVIVLVGLALGAYGAVLLLASGGALARHGAAPDPGRAKWRSRRAIGVIALGVVLVVLGALVLPLRNAASGVGPTGVVLLVLFELVALILDAVAVVILFLSGVPLAVPEEVDAQWLGRAQRLMRLGLGLLMGGLVAQLAGVAIIAL